MFNNVTIIGGGVLGTQIGLICAYTGHQVTFWLRSESSIGRTQPRIAYYSNAMLEALEKSKQVLGSPFANKLVPHGLIPDATKVTAADIDAMKETAAKNFKENVRITLDLPEALKDADIVIEAMSEDPKAKIDIYRKMNGLIPEKTILCTNSSTLLPSQFAEYTGCPERYLAMHFANNIWAQNTAEIMGHPGTSKEAFEQVIAFAKDINMVPIPIYKEQPGYVLNSLLVPFLTSALELWANGVADPETIDATWCIATGAPLGPFRIIDVVGLDTCLAIEKMKPDYPDPNSISRKIADGLQKKIDAGETGVVKGRGFYTYDNKK